MAVTWDVFFPYIQPHVPGCPEMTITQHLQEAAADFCERSSVWRYDIEGDFTAPGVSDYPIYTPAKAALENVLALYLEGFLVSKVSDSSHHLSDQTTLGRPSAYSIYQDESIRFYPVPDDTYRFNGVGVLKPTLDATGIEEFIYNTHGRAIACGALAKLLLVPSKEWSNPELATYYNSKFAKAADDAKGRDEARGEVRVAPQRFA